MSVMSNPYAPPESVSLADVALPPDTEFFFNRKCLAIADHVELPRLCVLTATPVPQKLERKMTLWWTPQIIRIPLLLTGTILAIASLSFAGGVIKNTARNPGGLAIVVLRMLEEMQIFGVVALGFLGLVVLGFVFGKQIQVRWFVSLPEIRRYRRRQAIWMLFWLTAGILLSIFPRLVLGATAEYLPLFVILVAYQIVRWIRGPRPLKIIGRLNGLYLLVGLSDSFLEGLQLLVRQRTESISVIDSPKPDTVSHGV